MVGVETVIADDPELLARTDPPPPHQPLRVVMDRRLRTPLGAKLAHASDHRHRVILVSTGDWPTPTPRFPGAGVEILCVSPAAGEGEIAAALRAICQHNKVGDLLLEGGGILAAAFLREGMVDRLEWFRAPIVLGAAGRPAIADLSYATLAEAPKWRRVALRELGPDLWESYERA
jgi:diaminohydroxyphosphoribosylaminopyrimidine deaminase/5-amino-6-(5-phosphoribosylamino)uracil reductase